MKSMWLMPLALTPLVLLTGAAPAASPLSAVMRDRLVTEAGVLLPEHLAFDRATNAVRTGGGSTSTIRTTDRWTGQRWSLVTTRGRQPSAREYSDYQRSSAAIPVPGYYQLSAIIAAATGSSTDAQGRTVLLIPVMPADSVRTNTGDISSHLQGEARLVKHGDTTWVDQLHVTAHEPFKLSMLIKVVGFEQTSEYAPGPDGKPRLVSQASKSNGTMFGFAGGEKAESSFVYR